MNFNSFIIEVKKRIKFEKGNEFDNDEWNDQYAAFKLSISQWNKEYSDSLSDVQKIETWLNDSYSTFDMEENTFCLRKKIKL